MSARARRRRVQAARQAIPTCSSPATSRISVSSASASPHSCAPQVPGERGRGGVVEDEGGGQAQAGGGGEAVAELDGGEGVEAELAEGAAPASAASRPAARARPRLPGRQDRRARWSCSGGRQGGQPRGQGAAAGGGRPGGRRGARRARARQQGGEPAGGRGARRGRGRAGTSRASPVAGAASSRASPCSSVTGRSPCRAIRGPGGLVEVPGHPGGPLPGPQASDGPASPQPAAVRGEGVQERVRRGVVPLARGAPDPGGRGEQHEGVQVQPGGQLVQVPGRSGLGREDRREPGRGQRPDHGAVVQDPGRVDHGAQRAPAGTAAITAASWPRSAASQAVTWTAVPSPASAAASAAVPGAAVPAGRPAPGAGPARGGQVPGHQRAQPPGPAGDQHRAVPGRGGTASTTLPMLRAWLRYRNASPPAARPSTSPAAGPVPPRRTGRRARRASARSRPG